MTTLLALFVLGAPGEKPFAFKGVFFEGCTCQNACAFELKGEMPGCNGVGFYGFDTGEFAGKSLKGTRVAFVAGSAGWLRLYYDGPANNRAAAKSFISSALRDWGKPEAVEYRPIKILREADTFTGSIDRGKTLKLIIQDAKEGGEPIVHKDIFNKLLHPEIMQARTKRCMFSTGKRKLDFKDTNGFFHPSLNVSGKLKT